MNRTRRIEAECTKELLKHGFENTAENRLEFYQGLRDAWKEDPSTGYEKSIWMFTLTSMIVGERLVVFLERTGRL